MDHTMYQVFQALWASDTSRRCLDVIDQANLRHVKGAHISIPWPQQSQACASKVGRSVSVEALLAQVADAMARWHAQLGASCGLEMSVQRPTRMDSMPPLVFDSAHAFASGEGFQRARHYLLMLSSLTGTTLRFRITTTTQNTTLASILASDLKAVADGEHSHAAADLVFQSIVYELETRDTGDQCPRLAASFETTSPLYNRLTHGEQLTPDMLSGVLTISMNSISSFHGFSTLFKKYFSGMRMVVTFETAGGRAWSVTDAIATDRQGDEEVKRRTVAHGADCVTFQEFSADMTDVSIATYNSLRSVLREARGGVHITFEVIPNSSGAWLMQSEDAVHETIDAAFRLCGLDFEAQDAVRSHETSADAILPRLVYLVSMLAQNHSGEDDTEQMPPAPMSDAELRRVLEGEVNIECIADAELASLCMKLWEARWAITHTTDRARILWGVLDRIGSRLDNGAAFLKAIYGCDVREISCTLGAH